MQSLTVCFFTFVGISWGWWRTWAWWWCWANCKSESCFKFRGIKNETVFNWIAKVIEACKGFARWSLGWVFHAPQAFCSFSLWPLLVGPLVIFSFFPVGHLSWFNYTLFLLYGLFLDATQVNNALWLASSEVVREYFLPPNSRKDEIACQELNFEPFFGILIEKKFFCFGSLCTKHSFTSVSVKVVDMCTMSYSVKPVAQNMA